MHNEEFDTEKEYWKKIQTGDELAFKKLYDTYWEGLFLKAQHGLDSFEMAQEVVQDIFTDLWVRRDKITIQKNIGAYLFAALKYRVLDTIRKQIVRDKYVHSILKSAQNHDNSTLDQIVYDDLHESISEAIQQLPKKCQEVFELSRFHHHSHREIAQKLGISEKTVENQITKALKFLKSHLNELIITFGLIIKF